ncbi:MAG: cupin domain-containing protein [Pseudomonadota bacterium]
MASASVVRAGAWTGGAPWEGHVAGKDLGTDVTILAVRIEEPGGGPRLHVHPYDEVFIVQEGHGRYTVGEETVDAGPGDMVLGPANVPHTFTNLGPGPLVSIDIHLSLEWIQTDLEGPDG